MIVLQVLAIGAALGVIGATPSGQSTDPPPRTATAARAATPPTIDGLATDAVWQSSPRFAEFRQFDPHMDAAPTLATEFRAAYDARNLYVFVRAFDPHPDSIMRALTRRDVRGPSDQIKIMVDSYNDQRSGFEFAVNPDGVKRDIAMYNDQEEDGSWDAVWDVATSIDSLGWTAEFRIPLSQLRYADGPEHVFGFGVWRDIERYAERVSWPVFTPTSARMVSQLGRLEGLVGLSSPRALEVTPYTVAKNVTRAARAGGFERDGQLALGADLRYGITPNITLNATVNPDFGQVEADPAVLNLSAFETFYAERRPFFVEGTGLYAFPLNCYIVVDCSTNEGLFYSRRIGRSPTLLQDYGEPATPAATPIDAAAKLTGRTPGGFSFGVLDALTDRVVGGQTRTVEPRTNYAVLRAQQDLRKGDAGISVIATAVNRRLDQWTDPVLHTSAYVAGASFRNRMFGGQYELAGSVTASRVAGSSLALLRTQTSAVHYLQQPDDEHALDSARTSLTGHAEQLKFGKYGGGISRFETSLVRQSAGFEVNDLGYLQRADKLDWSTWAALNFNTPRAFYRWWRFNGNHWQTWNTSGRRLEMAFNANTHIGLKNNWNLHLGGTLGGLDNSYCDRCTRGGPAVRESRGFYPWFGVNGDSRRMLVPSLWLNASTTDEGRSHSASLSPSLSLRFSPQFQASLGAGISRSTNDAQWFGNFTEATGGSTHYTFAHLQQRTLSTNLRLNYVATPDLSFEFYGQPFVSTGTYTDFRELSATPGADEFTARYQPYEPPADRARAFRFSQLRTNAVMRWEYRPGSTLFLVWAHGRQGYQTRESDRPWYGEYRDLFEEHPDNTFLVKLAYWVSR